MSLYLGKIHYWLFNKIVWFKDLELDFIKLADKKEIDLKNILEEITKNYGERVSNEPLEEIIDTSNIHGWLQDKIIVSESRLSELISYLKNNNVNDEEIKLVFKNAGRKAAILDLENRYLETAEDIFNGLNDYVLDGMPCDRVNEVLEASEESVLWKRRVCVHKEIWTKENLNADYFYEIRDEFIKEFISKVNPSFEYKNLGNNEMVISKIQ